MAINRTIQCDICGAVEAETIPNNGWQGWGALQGVVLDGTPNPSLCPACLSKLADLADRLKEA